MPAPGITRSTRRISARRWIAGVLAVALLAMSGGPAGADEDVDAVPSEAEIAAAEAAADASAMSVAEVQDRLAEANQQLWAATTAAEQATEAFNGARWRWQEAKSEAAIADSEELAAKAEASRQQQIYSDALVTSYQLAPELTALSAIMKSDGIETVIERSSTMMVAESALSARYDDLREARSVAHKASLKADKARSKAADAATLARQARDQARALVSSAASTSAAIAGERDGLLTRFAELRGISVALAEERQAALEAAPPEPTAPTNEPTNQPDEEPAVPDDDPEPASAPEPPAPTRNPSAVPSAPSPTTSPSKSPSKSPTPTPPPTSAPPVEPPVVAPAVSSGAAQAVAFARAQIGDRYQYGAAGPNAWDCSGLTQGAWAAGGKSLPHYSVAQYTQSTPIRSSQLQPGDLLFWGGSSSPNSIYHVALYVGGGKMIHAPRRGKPVTEVAVNYWIAPNFYARP